MGDFNRGRSRGDFNRGGFRNERSRGGFGGHRDNRENREMFDAICSKCGKPFKLPFFPKTDKPVFCDECFKSEKQQPRRDGEFNNKSSSDKSNAKIDLLISKMDEVLGLLKEKIEPNKVKVEKKVEKEEKKTKVKKEKKEGKKTAKKTSKK